MFLFALLALPLSAQAFAIPGYELVYTTPVETVLENKDLRGPLEVWTELFDGAKKSIDLEEQYLSSKAGEPLETVLDHLDAAAKRGVKVRLLLEQKMMKSATDPATVARVKQIPGLEFRTLDYSKLTGDGIIHAKFFIVDGKTAYEGSQNLDWRSLKHIHETGIRVSDAKVAKQIQAIFNFDWKAADLVAKGKKVPPLRKSSVLAGGKEKIYLVASPNAFDPPGVGNSEAEVVRLIGEAKKEIRITVLDYYPLSFHKGYYPVFDEALRDAQSRGVKVKLMVSHWNQEKPGIDYLKSLSLLPNVEVKIVTLPEAKEGFIPFARVNHSKFLTIDGETAWVGTSNWTGGYLDKSRNMEIVFREPLMAQRLVDLHEQLWSSPYAAKIDVTKDYPRPRKAK